MRLVRRAALAAVSLALAPVGLVLYAAHEVVRWCDLWVKARDAGKLSARRVAFEHGSTRMPSANP